jgi:hypothetical protein
MVKVCLKIHICPIIRYEGSIRLTIDDMIIAYSQLLALLLYLL